MVSLYGINCGTLAADEQAVYTIICSCTVRIMVEKTSQERSKALQACRSSFYSSPVRPVQLRACKTLHSAAGQLEVLEKARRPLITDTNDDCPDGNRAQVHPSCTLCLEQGLKGLRVLHIYTVGTSMLVG